MAFWHHVTCSEEGCSKVIDKRVANHVLYEDKNDLYFCSKHHKKYNTFTYIYNYNETMYIKRFYKNPKSKYGNECTEEGCNIV